MVDLLEQIVYSMEALICHVTPNLDDWFSTALAHMVFSNISSHLSSLILLYIYYLGNNYQSGPSLSCFK